MDLELGVTSARVALFVLPRIYQVVHAYSRADDESTIAEAALAVRTSVIEDVIRFASVMIDFTPASKATHPAHSG